MSDPKNDTRERVRALVKQVLAAVPPDASKVAEAAFKVEHVVVNSIADKVRKPFDRDESAKSLITEVDLRGLESGARLRIAANAKFTSLAEDIVKDRGIELIRKESRKSATKVRSVAIGADHGGFRLKEQIKDVLTDFGLQVRDFGTDSEEAVDYPDLAHAVAKSVAGHQVDIGIIVDGAGIGSAMTANKVPGVRAAACYSPALARNSREHNGANILTLGAGQNTFAEVKEIVEAFISSDIAEERHKKRVGKIDNIDRQYRK
ncbi:MAG TPA: RpiB/LacA/LacB family sugar-phosphate isomerase [Pyrinomonadaceae bacterium]|nr:RpiB/LacA/LacB family sugar-phosphate isomerase [Chloracidobacterium sp.]MBP9936638.1 RpiB/LacA/LacB family sugar-phosphate isomerase [Pyrinomonadaceae bacterium]MBK7802341.1 RpiB/LacA/LacB family sugar-phosphate isomerase [Chloracidobacterium sp.]MBK9437211.1 RpiB/LacA/LacB family sugar-phosphate isomerase [Chloracidobacterium sp.]MBL0239884.1 RpiB/LacA/LacB family sugar-phosphate isomerase [Chloracidobacterium sp.]